ncbi:acyltransferase [Marinilongibacter aquaticus]|uniref:acyltransferase n=1 Tax=Marinilongibacter aquaticus TaxID=2975157 RepID=UPI0021BD9723|nr:acyltransferase [Marinilongibacter aquaticus]UBM58072.1 acyltransferase [Marinilongibacter aquaticus]
MFAKIFKRFQLIFMPLVKQAAFVGVKMGENNFVASKFWSSEPYLIEIGNNCQITNGVKMFTHGGAQVVRRVYPKFDCFGKVIVGDFVYIGNNALIMPGVTIGDEVLIAAGSVVAKSVPSKVVVGGNPARIICTIEEYIERNLTYNLNSKGLSSEDKKEKILRASVDKLISKNVMTLTF